MVFQKILSRDYFREMKIRVLAAILKQNFLNVLFADLWLF